MIQRDNRLVTGPISMQLLPVRHAARPRTGLFFSGGGDAL